MHAEALISLSWISLGAAAICGGIIAADLVMVRRQQMAVMNVVWPITALYAGPLALAAYFAFGREKSGHGGREHEGHQRPMWQLAFLGTTHCGAACALGDVVADGGLFLAGGGAVLGSTLFTSYVFDFVAAYVLGIGFQYFRDRSDAAFVTRPKDCGLRSRRTLFPHISGNPVSQMTTSNVFFSRMFKAVEASCAICTCSPRRITFSRAVWLNRSGHQSGEDSASSRWQLPVSKVSRFHGAK